jgi:photosystem II stability/assembly factor-like uncharacterized protein
MAYPWLSFGPYGGDARAFASDPVNPAHLYLGTLTGWLFTSDDAGATWIRLSQIGKRDDLVLDNILVDPADPKHIVVGAWVLDRVDGGIFSSTDGGVTWTQDSDMRGQSVRALAAAPSNSKILYAGTLSGVYRSGDGGIHWHLISPEGSREIHEVESLAVDPVDPETLYAGTWHLPWKTTDGGQNWTTIKDGIIDDSDVFSIIVDPKSPSTVYASACSGIYKSDSAGAKFQKVQGIPSTARRTRVLMQDPKNRNVVFAGTTEGLYRTTDAGHTWTRTTPGSVIVNDVHVDPSNPNHVLLATDRGGVLTSSDGGTTFISSNKGFSARQVVAYVRSSEDPRMVYVGVVNDKELGGVFFSKDDGLSWEQREDGLHGLDVFSLVETKDGVILAGTAHGLYALKGMEWTKVETKLIEEAKPEPVKAVSTARETAVRHRPGVKKSRREAKPTGPMTEPFEPAIDKMANMDDTLLAATSNGLYKSADSGLTWTAVTGLPSTDLHFVDVVGKTITTGSLHAAFVSRDAGSSWTPIPTADPLKRIGAFAADDQGGLWMGGREGLYTSMDDGGHWKELPNLLITDVNSLSFDATTKQLFVTGTDSPVAFEVQFPDQKVTRWDTGWTMRFIHRIGDHMIGATLFDGMVLQPRMVDSTQASQ